jgi:methionine aminopeptidase
MTFKEFKNQYEYVWNSAEMDNPNTEIAHRIGFDISGTNKVLSDHALYAVHWFIVNGFEGKITKNNTAKTEYIVQKEGVTDTFTLTATNQSPTKCNIEKYMELFDKSFNMKCQLEHLKNELRK